MVMSPALRAPLAAVFFDLDGTLADTATDLSLPINAMREAQGLPALQLAYEFGIRRVMVRED